MNQYEIIVIEKERIFVSLIKEKGGYSYYNHGFKNRTGPAGPTGSTGNRPLIRSSYDKKPEIWKKPEVQ